MDLPHFIDYVGGALALIVPAYIVLRFPRWQTTVLLGTIAFWLITVGLGYLLSALDPSRDAAMLDTLWFLIGWIPGVFYSWLLYGIRLCVLRAMRPQRSHR